MKHTFRELYCGNLVGILGNVALNMSGVVFLQCVVLVVGGGPLFQKQSQVSEGNVDPLAVGRHFQKMAFTGF